ncbi:MAG: hypothetical protein IT293_06115 [Deltaproteobacteria bacterium]|nr:hypothetical protein [Deltaproteobacteria bacterium]
MKAGHFLHCRDCETIFRPSPSDRAPEYRMTPRGIRTIARDDCMDFLTRHARHHLVTLRPIEPAFHTGALWDASAPTYWQVSDGDRTAVVEGTRSQLGSPLRYRLRAGRVVAERVAVEVPDAEIRRQIDRALYPGVAPERKLAAFCEAFKRVAWDLDPALLEILYDVPGDPTMSVARLSAPALTELRDCARRIFDRADSAKVEAIFAGTEDDPAGFTVLVHQRVRVEG